MSKMRKLLAMVLALAMVLGMSMTTMAAEAPEATASITVDGLTANDNTVLKHYQIVKLNVKKSKWEVVDQKYAPYVNLDKTPITINWDGLKSVVPASEGVTTNATSHTFTNLEVGAYLILATGNTTTYNVMGEGTYDYDDKDHLIVPVDKEISAKASGYTVVKSLKNLDNTFVAKGDTVNFDITTVFPSYPDEKTNRVFTITDTPTGMKITGVEVFVGDMENALAETYYAVSELNVPDQAVTVTFKPEYIGDKNVHATENVKVVVTAVVTSDNAYSNEATSNFDSTPDKVTGDVGSLTIKKVDENKNVLKGAKFEIKLGDQILKFAPTGVAGEYSLVAGATETASTDEVLVESPASGIIKLTGLGAGTYDITEKEAPAGYSVVEVDSVTIAEGEQADIKIEVMNTKLVELPHTGGIGTTIFTIAGCGIMIAAAYLFFASRRKEEA